jgi:mRNA interferase HigB
MRIISRPSLTAYGIRRPDTAQLLQAWYDEARRASWKTPQDIKARFPSASFVAPNRVVFNIKGNAHRLVVAVSYEYGAIYIKFIGNHAEYDKIDVATVELE